jgi:hypothetical protein
MRSTLEIDVRQSFSKLCCIANVAKVICVGANWMHRRRSKTSAANILEDEGRQRRLYSWLIICDDSMSLIRDMIRGSVNHF